MPKRHSLARTAATSLAIAVILAAVTSPLHSEIFSGSAAAAGTLTTRPPASGAPGARDPGEAPIGHAASITHDTGCTAAGCHAPLASTRWVHAPVATSNCAACHTAVGEPEAHEFAPIKDDSESCAACHAFGDSPVSVHLPFAAGSCGDCHNPHGGDRKSFIRTDTSGALCATCHDDVSHTFGHPPVDRGDCLTCHDPHQSRHEALLVRSQEQLCFTCHRDMDHLGVLTITRRDGHPPFMHEPMLDPGCTACHLPHGGEAVGMLAQNQRTLCLSCHESTVHDLPLAQSVHGAFQGESSCTQCHEPHAGDHESMLVASPFDLCMRCHDETITLKSGEVLPNMKQVIEESPVVHAPAANGDCASCHAPHFSPQKSLLRVNYPDRDYQKFDVESYAMCLECHDPSLVTEPYSSVTGFREGDLNLHYMHVNREKGRSCRICHQPHAGALPKLMREEFPFGSGGWNLPIGFAPTETGGTCTSACHEPRWYNNTYSPELERRAP